MDEASLPDRSVRDEREFDPQRRELTVDTGGIRSDVERVASETTVGPDQLASETTTDPGRVASQASAHPGQVASEITDPEGLRSERGADVERLRSEIRDR